MCLRVLCEVGLEGVNALVWHEDFSEALWSSCNSFYNWKIPNHTNLLAENFQPCEHLTKFVLKMFSKITKH